MADDVMRAFDRCLEKGKIKRFVQAKRLVKKELSVAGCDLAVAKKGLGQRLWKWCTIQAYYSMFHTARALLYSEGYREKSHYCLMVAIAKLFVETGKLPERFVDALSAAKTMRERADYEEHFSETGAQKLVSAAEDFLAASRTLLTRKHQG